MVLPVGGVALNWLLLAMTPWLPLDYGCSSRLLVERPRCCGGEERMAAPVDVAGAGGGVGV